MVQPKKESFRMVEKRAWEEGMERRKRGKETGEERGKVSTHIFISG